MPLMVRMMQSCGHALGWGFCNAAPCPARRSWVLGTAGTASLLRTALSLSLTLRMLHAAASPAVMCDAFLHVELLHCSCCSQAGPLAQQWFDSSRGKGLVARGVVNGAGRGRRVWGEGGATAATAI
jgi:hypothetical protein